MPRTTQPDDALADIFKLTPFEGRDVIAAGIVIPGAGGGLRDALNVEPRELHVGDEVTIVFKLVVAKVRFDPIKSTDALTRVHTMDVREATFAKPDTSIDSLFDENRRRIAAAQGKPELPLP